MIRNAVAVMLFWCSVAYAESPTALCARVGTDDTTRPIPADLVSAANSAFKTALPPQVAMDSTVFRCAEGHVLACTAGANLPCGKANTPQIARQSLHVDRHGFIAAFWKVLR